MDFPRFLAFLYAIESDSNFITTALDQVGNAVRNLSLLSELEENALTLTKGIAKKFIALLSAVTFIKGITREIKIPEEYPSEGAGGHSG